MVVVDPSVGWLRWPMEPSLFVSEDDRDTAVDDCENPIGDYGETPRIEDEVFMDYMLLLDGVSDDYSFGEIWCPHITGAGGNFLHEVLCTCHLPVSHICLGEPYETDFVIGEDVSSK